MLPLIEREILIAELLETTAIKCDVFHCCILAAEIIGVGVDLLVRKDKIRLEAVT